ncbi:hypothetical protein [Kitasatospora camelliae]|uniref:Uncharacterized protein n=1 Tax=Kitasatospora camelliae TaxID=3156397 RepID=A0AAU8K3N9_9ACTN
MSPAAAAPQLPAGLKPWAEGLSALTPGLAVEIGPLVRRIDALIAAGEPLTAPDGDLDGYGGLDRSGVPERLAVAEWLLAEELPEEFLRRLVERELLYTSPEFRREEHRGRVVALVDAGPAQAGPGRLVQLAALLVLYRRAAARGSELVVGVLGEAPEQWLTGELTEVLPRWLRGRRDEEPVPADLARAEGALEAADEAWLLASPDFAAELPSRRRTLVSEIAAWGPMGATRVRVSVGGQGVELPLPAGDIAVRALRGAEFRRATGAAAVLVPDTPDFGAPAFTGTSRTLLVRTAPDRLLVARVPSDHGIHTTRPTRHTLPGGALAAARIGRRLITLVASRGRLRTHVIGKPFGTREPLDPAALGLDESGLAELLRGPLLPLLQDGADLLCPVAGTWWRIRPDGGVRDDGPVEPPPGPDADGPDAPADAFPWPYQPRIHPGPVPAEVDAAPHRRYGAEGVAWSEDGRHWWVARPDGARVEIRVPDGDRVLGLVTQGPQAALITRSANGVLVRSVRPGSSRTLSSLSDGGGSPLVHPALPLVAARLRGDRIVVGDAFTGATLLTLGGSA